MKVGFELLVFGQPAKCKPLSFSARFQFDSTNRQTQASRSEPWSSRRIDWAPLAAYLYSTYLALLPLRVVTANARPRQEHIIGGYSTLASCLIYYIHSLNL